MKTKYFLLSLFIAVFMMMGQVNASDRVNLNTATVAQLQTLSGVGPKTAAAIATYRSEHGFFTSIDDLSKVQGIGEKKLDRIRDAVEITHTGE